jgi:ABC-type glycerol-3-phosphate transport system substrate-binding protein
MRKSWIVLLMAVSALSACGGGDDTPAPPAVTEAVPTSASASVGGLMDYLKALVVASADNLEPVDVSAVTPPVDDTGDAAIVD